MSEIIPLFSTSSSFGQGGIFTVEEAGKSIKNGKKIRGPESICDLAKEEGLTKVYLVETKFASFMEAYKNLKKINCDLHFGLKLCVCEDMNVKTDDSLKTESNIIIWPAVDSVSVYEKFIKISSKAAIDGFYYRPRIDWKTLCAMWSDDLLLSLPFYSSFIQKNTLTFSTIVPELPAKPLVLREVGQQLPFDEIINEAIAKYAASNDSEVQDVKSIYYKNRAHAKSWQIWRCILDRTDYDKPNMEHCASSEFCWESYKEIVGGAVK